jgi:hypothetical protein
MINLQKPQKRHLASFTLARIQSRKQILCNQFTDASSV